jgi:amino acid adenylation domain-containing protein
MHQLARCLAGVGVQRGDRVGIYLHRSIESAIAVYGIMHCGAAFVPLDPAAPAARTQGIIRDCGIEVLISSDRQKTALQELPEPGTPLRAIVGVEHALPGLETISWKEVFHAEHRPFEAGIGANDLAYIMFTSGTTGKPKGIMHTHYSGLNYARLSTHLYGVTDRDVVGNVAPLFFDMSTFGYFSSPFAGARCILFSDADLTMLGSLAKLVGRERVTILYAVPLVFTQLLDLNLIDNFETVKWIKYGGEPFPPKKLNEIIRRLPGVTVSNVYGPAEVNQCTYKNISEPVDEDKSIPLGEVWSETEIKIVDDLDREVGKGDQGELLVASSTMMQGYWNRPDLNEKAFYVERRNRETVRYYRTGDLVYLNEEGELVFSGRKDRQAKIRGYRVELREIENALSLIDGIASCAVYIVDDSGEKTLCAAYTADKGRQYTAQQLRQTLQQYVPKYSIPSHFTAMDEIPRAKSGKVDYALLEKQFMEKKIENS